jgi:hypothetical protein
MGFLKNLFGSRSVENETDVIAPGTQMIDLGDGATGFLIPTQTEEAPSRKIMGDAADSEGRVWEVSAAANAVWLYNKDENEYVFFDLVGANAFANLLDDAISHAHLS